MRTYLQSGVRCLLGISALTAALVVLPESAAWGYAVSISGNVSPTMTYVGSPGFLWSIPGAPLTSGSVPLSDGVTTLSISPTWSTPGALNWASPLDDFGDLSSGGLAYGIFAWGGTFSIDGQLYASNAQGSTLLASGLLFEGVVSDFEIRESSQNSNRINLGGTAIVIPTGGWLKDHGYTVSMYSLSMLGVDCQQNSSNLVNFQSDIVTVSALNFSLDAIPEPASVMLAAMASLWLARSRRRP